VHFQFVAFSTNQGLPECNPIINKEHPHLKIVISILICKFVSMGLLSLGLISSLSFFSLFMYKMRKHICSIRLFIMIELISVKLLEY
jgi:hypothetical protein